MTTETLLKGKDLTVLEAFTKAAEATNASDIAFMAWRRKDKLPQKRRYVLGAIRRLAREGLIERQEVTFKDPSKKNRDYPLGKTALSHHGWVLTEKGKGVLRAKRLA